VTRRCLVVSAVNFTEGGPLTVLQDFLQAAGETLSEDWDIVAFVHDHRLVRIWFEWHELHAYSINLHPDLWVSLHDMSPNVGSVRQVVYCHNPAPFFRMRIRDAFLDPSLLLFRLGYKWLYRFNIKRNYAVIVQQSWLRTEFQKWCGVNARVLVAHPSNAQPVSALPVRSRPDNYACFLYPVLPRAFKNIELLCRAARRLEENVEWRSQILLTMDGTESRYARWLFKRYGDLDTVRFIGRQSREAMLHLYTETDCLLFPSRLETWGLPISEAKQRDLPMFIADLPYARESVGTYDKVDFIDIDDHDLLAAKLLAFQRGEFRFPGAVAEATVPPFVSGWGSLVKYLVQDLD
jgi:glycosyltransferase involved in cell wall biosynthesis